MLNTLLDIQNDGNVFLQDNALVQAPKLWKVYKNKNMGSDMVRYIVFMFDYKSIYRQLPLEQRKKRVVRTLWDGKASSYIENEIVLEAIDEYIDIQYDPDIEAYQIMLEKSHDINNTYRDLKVTKENIEYINSLQEKMAKASESRIRMLEIIKKTKDSDKRIYGKGNSKKFSRAEQSLRDKGK